MRFALRGKTLLNSSQRMKPKARTLLLLALLLCTARAASAQGSSAAPAPEVKPVSIALVVDASTSVGALNKTGGKQFLESFARFAAAEGGRDEFLVVKVSTQASLYLDRTEDAAEVSKALGKLFSKREVGATALFDGCALGVEKLANARREGRFVLLLSDGVDTTSELTLEDVEGLLKRAGVKLFAIEMGQRDSLPAHDQGGFRNLEQLAKASGGAAYRVKKASEFDSILTSIRAQLRR
jgi:Ca-activated chloride channel family protein